jgi:sugar porter (SP) family MFS transporter
MHSKVLQSENSRTRLTLSEKSESVPKKFPQFLASTLATLIALCLGMCLTWTSPALPMLEKSERKITEAQGAWIGSLLTLGACLGAIPTGSIANFIGRKRTLQMLALPLFASWLTIAYGNRVEALYVARFVAGLAIGGVSVAAPMYVAELAHTSIRGTLGTFFQVQITVGVLLEYLLGGTVASFKCLALASSVFPILFLVGFSFMPETPVYLYGKGRVDAARKSLEYFRGRHYNLDEELLRIADDIKEANTNKAKLSDLFSCRATLNGLIVSLGLMVFQQMSGINAVLFYTGNIFAETGSLMAPDTSAILVGTVQLIATLLSTLLIDRAGRKILLFISSFVMCVCLVSLGIYFHLKQTHDLSYLSVLPLVTLAVFIVVFSIGLGPIPWIMMGEIFTPKNKGVASSVSASFNWILAFTVTNQFQNMTGTWGTGVTFIIFGIICGIGALFVGFLVPETKGKDIDEVQNLLLESSVLNCTCRRTESV